MFKKNKSEVDPNKHYYIVLSPEANELISIEYNHSPYGYPRVRSVPPKQFDTYTAAEAYASDRTNATGTVYTIYEAVAKAERITPPATITPFRKG
jgi:hypothetical protein